MKYSYGSFTLCIYIATNTNAKLQVKKTGDDKVMLETKNYILTKFQIQIPLILVGLQP